MMNPQDAELLCADPGGNLAIKTHAIRKQTMFNKLPAMRGRRLPSLSTNNTQHASPIKAMMLLIAWYFRALDPEIPILPYIVTE
jgi:hypothetical protein